MARKPRFTLPGVPQHLIQRGNNRNPCFFGEVDYSCYLEHLQEASGKNKAMIHAFVLMTNHVHVLVTPGHRYSIPHMMQDLGRKYVRYINHTYRRTGTLWEGRYKASLIDSDRYLLTCMRYIELNPIRANMVSHPGEYRWSSYACNAMGKSDSLIEPHPLYTALGEGAEERQYAYREMFATAMEYTEIHAIREAVSQELVLGRDDFKDKIERTTKRQTKRRRPGRPRKEEKQAMQ